MKTFLEIKGQIIGNRKLLRACDSINCIDVYINSDGYKLEFKTKKAAIKALFRAYKELKSDKDNWENANCSYKYGASLSYDASQVLLI